MKRNTVSPRVVAILVSILTAWSAIGVVPHPPTFDFSSNMAYAVARVIDGDTIEIVIDGKHESLRLIGVDTPETVHPSKPVQAYGKEASAFMSNLLQGEEVYLRYGDALRDKYNRLLAYVFRAPDGLFVNLELVRQGYGHAYIWYPFEYLELFRHYEQRARENGKGLWATPAEQPSPSGLDNGTPTTQPLPVEKPADVPTGCDTIESK